MMAYYIAKVLKKFRLSAVRGSRVHRKAYLSGGNTIINCKIDKYTYTSYDTQIIHTDIGAYCSIGSDCKIGGAGHPTDWVSTSPLFHVGKNVFGKHFSEHDYAPYVRTSIGNDVWIGQNVLIKSGVSIGNGAVIGMGAVVTKDIGPYEVWAGNPAKFIRKRFDDEIIEKLEKLQWWSWSDEKIKEYSHAFTSVNQLLDVAQNEEK